MAGDTGSERDVLDAAVLGDEVRRRCPATADELLAGLRPCLRLATSPVDGDACPLGASRIGGRPDVPAGFEWPTWVAPRWAGQGESLRLVPGDGRVPLHFVAQIDLDAAAAAGPTAPLPGEGMVWFFADLDRCTGLVPQERDGVRVLWLPEPGALLRHDPPSGLPSLPAAAVTFRLAPSLPDDLALGANGGPTGGSHGAASGGMPDGSDGAASGGMPDGSHGAASGGMADDRGTGVDDEAEQLARLRDDIDAAVGSPVRHQLAGNPEGIQHAVLDQAVQAVNGLLAGQPFDVERWRQVQSQVARWHLLLQIDSDEHLGLHWGDGGRLYFLAETSDPDLAATATDPTERFTRVWFLFQE